MLYTHLILHYDEITLKGGNRPFFERVLVNNIKEFLKDIGYKKIYKDSGKIVVNLKEGSENLKIKEILKNIPGISNFSFAEKTKNDIGSICKKTVELLNRYENIGKIKTFKIIARRSDKKFYLKSPEINAKVGEYVLENAELKVDVHNPGLEIVIDVGANDCFIYFEKIKGVGGLPVGSTGKLISLISGGIDSPVASYMMMKRGAKIIFVHFKNRTIESGIGEDKIKKLAKILSSFQGRSKLYIAPFEAFQREIIAKVPAKNRMIIYRRTMFRISEMIAKKEGTKGFVTGDSLGQVASQTLENINAIYKAASFPIFAPLIGFNKQETIDLAKSIGTYETSIFPYQDCCSFLIAKHPETKANLSEIIGQEKNLEIDKLAEKIVRGIKPKII